MAIRNSPLLTCALYTVGALSCSHSLHYPESSRRHLGVKGSGRDGEFIPKIVWRVYLCSTDFTTDDVVEHLSSHPCYFTYISTWRWRLVFSPLPIAEYMLSLHCGHPKICGIYLPSAPIPTPGHSNNAIVQVAISTWHPHLRIISTETDWNI